MKNNRNDRNNKFQRDDRPFMSDQKAEEHRKRLIEAGVIVETGRDEFMSLEEIETFRGRLIAGGFLVLGSGRYSRPNHKTVQTLKVKVQRYEN